MDRRGRCGRGNAGGGRTGTTTLSMWYHGAGNEVEAKIINQIIADFNASQSDWKVELQSFPQAANNDSVVAGALSGNLPDGPLDSTQTIVFQAVERGYGKQDISGGSTISVLLFLIVLSVSHIQRWLTRDKEAK